MKSELPEDIYSTLARLATVALLIVLGVGIMTIFIGYMVMESNFYPDRENVFARNLLFILGILELAAIQFVKKGMLARIRSGEGNEKVNHQTLLPVTIVIAAMCSSISFCGLLTVIFGASLEALLLFVAVSLIGYQLFRLRPRDFE